MFSLCLTIVFQLQLVAGVLGFIFSDKVQGKVSEIINNAIVHYRDDLDIQNLINFSPEGVQLLWRDFLQLVPEYVLQLFRRQPQPWALFWALLLLLAYPQPGSDQHHVWLRYAGLWVLGSSSSHLHPRLYWQIGQLDTKQPFHTWWCSTGSGHPAAGGNPVVHEPCESDQRSDQTTALQPAAPGGLMVLKIHPAPPR